MRRRETPILNSAINWLRRLSGKSTGPGFLRARPDLAAHKIGDWSYGDLRVISFNRNGRLEIGKYCSFANGVRIFLGGEHNTSFVSTYPMGVFFGLEDRVGHERTKGDVVIGSDVWVANSATILSGVKIGHGAVIGAHSVVSRDVPDYAIAAGNPAKVLRHRFDPATIHELLQIAWWEWPDDKVKAEARTLMSGDLEGFIARHRRAG